MTTEVEAHETKEIANCSGCPMFLRDPGLCTHWGSPEFNRIPWHQQGLPEWCPLKEKPLLLKVVQPTKKSDD